MPTLSQKRPHLGWLKIQGLSYPKLENPVYLAIMIEGDMLAKVYIQARDLLV